MSDDNKQKNRFQPKMNRSQSITFWIVILLMVVVVFHMYNLSKKTIKEVFYSDFIQMVENNQVATVVFDERDATFWQDADQKYHTFMPKIVPDSLLNKLLEHNVSIISKRRSQLVAMLVGWLPILIFIAFWF
ncbi:MAG: ATP-dependent metallopeptidase FtsH/Yme1/Tma family protein, partial [Candidatus Cloacimonetes bacterium]|nr:ATP-dependent metallopeptidase FtsH/Yme1/Tma family protein [Candidatus Cloacimonadota bacterium]